MRIWGVFEILIIVGSGTLAQTSWAQGYDGIFQYARSLLKEQRYSEAAAEARKAVALDKTRWEGYYVAATAYAGLQRCEAAIPYFQSALEHGAPEPIQATINGAVSECERQVNASPTVPQSAADGLPAAIQERYGPIVGYVRLTNGNYVVIPDHRTLAHTPAFSLLEVRADGILLRFNNSLREPLGAVRGEVARSKNGVAAPVRGSSATGLRRHLRRVPVGPRDAAKARFRRQFVRLSSPG